MKFPRTLHTDIVADSPTFTVKVDGKILEPKECGLKVQSIVINRSVNRISTADMILFDGEPAKSDFKASSMDQFIPNAPIEISLGYHTDNTLVFKGIITHHSIKIFRNKPSVLHLTCKDEAVKLTVGRKNAYFYGKDDKFIINSLITDRKLKADVGPTKVTHPEMVQFYSTDWDFILSRAEANGKLVYTEDGKVLVKAPVFTQDPALRLLHGATMLDFEAEIDARYQYDKVNAYSWDSSTQELKEVKGKDPKVKTPGDKKLDNLSDTIGLKQFEIRHAGQIKDVELQEWANAQWLKSQLGKIRGRVRFQGHSGIMPGNMIELGGVGDRFNGNAFVSGVRHEFNENNWETDVSFGLDPTWFHEQFEDIQSNPAEGLLPAVKGLTIGIVTKLEGDPEGQDRIQVKIPMIDPDGEGVWSRIACLDAGENRGSFFRPDVKDEVILGFLNDDPRNPIVLGQLNSSKKPAPEPTTKDNFIKGFFSREGLKFIFNEEDKSITLITPREQKLIIDDKACNILIEDLHGNKILMNNKGITIDSYKDLFLNAANNITGAATASMELSGVDLTASGSASAEFSSSGPNVIKGTPVKIN